MFGAILKEKLDWTKFEVPWPSKFLETLNSDFTHEIGILEFLASNFLPV